MAEITEDLIKQAEEACRLGSAAEALIIARDVTVGGALGSIVGTVVGPTGSAIGAALGIELGVLQAPNDIKPDAACVAHVLKDQSRER